MCHSCRSATKSCADMHVATSLLSSNVVSSFAVESSCQILLASLASAIGRSLQRSSEAGRSSSHSRCDGCGSHPAGARLFESSIKFALVLRACRRQQHDSSCI